MIAEVRSELIRTRRRSYLWGWLGLTTLLSGLVTVVVFQTAGGATAAGPKGGPGAGFPTLAQLQGSHGLVAALGGTSKIVGVVTLGFWAVTAASDYQSGLVRILVQAQPHRLRLLAGKFLALATWTAGIAALTVAVSAGTSAALAGPSHVSTAAWTSHWGSLLASGWLDTFAALLVWGAIGLVLAIATRSASVAISAGVGYVLVGESIVSLAASGASRWLPGSLLGTLASGGSSSMSFATAAALALAYGAAGTSVAAWLFRRREITY